MWSKVCTLPTPLSEKLVHRGPQYFVGFPLWFTGAHLYSWVERETMWSNVSIPATPAPLSKTRLVHKGSSKAG